MLESTRPFRYDLNQIPYGYTMEVMNRFKGLYLVDRVPKELWMEVCNIVTGGGDQKHSKKKKCKKAKWIFDETLQTAEKRSERQRRKGEIYPTEIARRNKKTFLNEQCKEIKENNRMENRDSRKVEIPKEHFMQRWAQCAI